MANELRQDYVPGTLGIYAVLRSGGGATIGQFYNGTGFENGQTAHWATYKIPLTETDTTGAFYANMPTLDRNFYEYVVYLQIGVNPVPTDPKLGKGFINWSGTTDVNVQDIIDNNNRVDVGRINGGPANLVPVVPADVVRWGGDGAGIAVGANHLPLVDAGTGTDSSGVATLLSRITGPVLLAADYVIPAVPGDAMTLTVGAAGTIISGVAAQITADHGDGSYVSTGSVDQGDIQAAMTAQGYTPELAAKLETGGGGTGTGDGAIHVDHNYGGADALAIETTGGQRVDNATILCYRADDYNANRRDTGFVVARTTTNVNGEWVEPLMLDPANYVLLVYKQEAIEPEAVPLTVVVV